MGSSRLFAGIALIWALASGPVAAFEFPTLTQPSWKELSPQQKQVLTPLAGEWDQMDAHRRKKWIGIAARFPYMTEEEQERVRTQMREWAQLTPTERKVVREKFKTLRKTPEERATVKQKWESYKELPEEEKQRLKEEAKSRPAPKASTATKPTLTPTPVKSITKAKPSTPSVPNPVPPEAASHPSP